MGGCGARRAADYALLSDPCFGRRVLARLDMPDDFVATGNRELVEEIGELGRLNVVAVLMRRMEQWGIEPSHDSIKRRTQLHSFVS